MRRLRGLLVLVVLTTLAVLASGANDVSVTTDTVVPLSGYTNIELHTIGGNATFVFFDGGASPDTVSTRLGRSGVVRTFSWSFPTGIDSLLIDVHTASEIIYSLK